MNTQDFQSAIVSAWANLSRAKERYERVASPLSDPTALDELTGAKDNLDSATRAFNQACDAHYKAATKPPLG
jgi:hypothetical protein